MADGRATPTSPKHEGRWLRAFLGVTASLSLIVAVLGGYGYAAFRSAAIEMPHIPLYGAAGPPPSPGSSVEPTTSPKPAPIEGKCDVHSCNYLLLGSDSRTGLKPKELKQFGTTAQVGGQRSDVIMLVHIDPDTNHATIVSFPRDLWVHIPGHGSNKINAAFYQGLNNGGPELVASTVTHLTGLKVNHVMYVDFAKFQGVVTSLHGVPMCITTRMVDPLTGLNLWPGCQTLDAQQALAFVRTRHQPCDTIPDFARIARQQQFLRAVMAKALSPSELPQVASIVKSVAKNIVTDPQFNLGEVIYLVSKLQGLATGLADFRVVPTTPAVITPGGVTTDIVKLVQPQANQLFADLRTGKSLGKLGLTQQQTALSPAVIPVTVYDHHSGTKALGVVHVLQEGGFNVGSAPAPTTGMQPIPSGNVILYGSKKDKAMADVVQNYLPAAREVLAKKGQLPAGQKVAAVISPGYVFKPLGQGPTSCATTP